MNIQTNAEITETINPIHLYPDIDRDGVCHGEPKLFGVGTEIALVRHGKTRSGRALIRTVPPAYWGWIYTV